MKQQDLVAHLSYILRWWEAFVDWEKGGIFTYPHFFKRERRSESKNPLMHLRQIYNYAVGVEAGHPGAEKIARHLYDSLYETFPEKEGSLMVGSEGSWIKHHAISGYLNAYQVICLSRYARTFQDRTAAQTALTVYQELDQLLTDGNLRERGTWGYYYLEDGRKHNKSDNAHIHRCEAALNLLRALETAAPDLADQHRSYLQNQLSDICYFFSQHIACPEGGFTHEYMEDDGKPRLNYEYYHQSLAHAFEWFGFCREIETYAHINLPFENHLLHTLCQNTLSNGLRESGCFCNNYVISKGASTLTGDFWPQVETLLGTLWARKHWGETAFPFDISQRLWNFYQENFIIPEELGGGILTTVSENGVPISYSTGHAFKCDHHAVRLVEKAVEFDLLGEVPV